MQTFKSPETTSKLYQKIKELTDPIFEFGDKKQIESSLKKFCKDNQKDSFSESRKNRERISQQKVSKNTSSKMKAELQKNLNSENLTLSADKVLQIFDNELEMNRNLDLINPIVKMFGNNLISSVFKSLVITAMEKEFDIPVDDPLTFSNDTLLQFGISIIHLQELKTNEEKYKYIKDVMNELIERLMKSWNEKIEFHKRQHEEAEMNYANIKRKSQKEFKDIFDWMVLKTKYEALKRKLKTVVVQKLNDYENQIKILETFKKRRTYRSSVGKILSTEMKINLEHVAAPDMNELLRTKYFDEKNIKLTRAPGCQYKERCPSATISFNLKNSYLPPEEKRIWSSSKNNNANKLKKQADDEKRMYEVTWDDSLEKVFLQKKRMDKALFTKEIKYGKWNGVSLINIIQEILTKEKKSKDRNLLLDKYANRDYLSPEEYKFLADTSEALNRCIDRKFVQKAVNIIEPDIINYLELNLAEEIISQYKIMNEIMFFARKEFFKSKNEMILAKLSARNSIVRKKEILQMKSEKRLKKQKTISYLVKKVQEIEKQKFMQEEEGLINDIRHNITFTDYEKKIARKQKENQLKKIKPFSRLFDPKLQDVLSDINNPKLIKHKYHPASKLFYFDKKELSEKKNAEKILQNMNEHMDEFKLQISSPIIYKIPTYFKSFYSGGPTPASDVFPLINKYGDILRSATQSELRNIIYIQSRMRGFLIRKKFRVLKEDAIRKKYVNLYDKLSILNENYESPKKNKGSVQNISILSKQNFFSKSQNQFYDKKSKEMYNSSESWMTRGKNEANFTIKMKKLFEFAQKNINILNNIGFHYSSKELNSQDNKNNTPLFYAVKAGNLNNCVYLINNGANPNAKCFDNNTPIHIAVQNKMKPILLFLLNNGGSINDIVNNEGKVPAQYLDDKLTTFLVKNKISFLPKDSILFSGSNMITHELSTKSAYSTLHSRIPSTPFKKTFSVKMSNNKEKLII